MSAAAAIKRKVSACFVPALLHFLVAEISPVYLTYGASRSFIQKMALARERVRLTEEFGFDVKEAKSQLTSAQLGGMTFKERKKCVEDGVSAAMWSLNPKFTSGESATGPCFSPHVLWKTPNVLGIFHLSCLVVNVTCVFFWCCIIINARIWSWGEGRYFVFTWQLETTPEYKVLSHFNLGLAVSLTLYAVGTLYMSEVGWEGLFSFLKYSWAELAAMFHAAHLLMKSWQPPYAWQEGAFASCHFLRSPLKIHQSNDDFGRKLSDALLRMATGKKGELDRMMENTDMWPVILYSNQEIMEGKHKLHHPLVPLGTSPRELELHPLPSSFLLGPAAAARAAPAGAAPVGCYQPVPQAAQAGEHQVVDTQVVHRRW